MKNSTKASVASRHRENAGKHTGPTHEGLSESAREETVARTRETTSTPRDLSVGREGGHFGPSFLNPTTHPHYTLTFVIGLLKQRRRPS